jgi:hypothetical protein
LVIDPGEAKVSVSFTSSVADVAQAEQIALDRTSVRAAALHEANQAVGAV